MTNAFHIVVCGGIVPDPLQTLEPVTGPAGPVWAAACPIFVHCGA